MKALRIGVLGAEQGVSDRWIQAFNAVEGVEIAAVADRYLELARWLARLHEIPAAYGSLAEMLAGGHDLNALVVAAPAEQRSSYTREVIEAGLDVFCATQLAGKTSEWRKVLAVAKHADRLLAAGFRFPYQVGEALEFVRNELGTVRSVWATWLRREEVTSLRLGTDAVGHGGCPDMMSDLLAVVLPLVGSRPTWVSAQAWDDIARQQYRKQYRGRDRIEAGITFANRARATVTVAWGATVTDDELSLVVEGTLGRLVLPLMIEGEDPDRFLPTFFRRVGSGYSTEIHTESLPLPPIPERECCAQQASDFVRACLHDEPLRYGSEHAFLVQAVLEIATRSMAAGGEQRWL